MKRKEEIKTMNQEINCLKIKLADLLIIVNTKEFPRTLKQTCFPEETIKNCIWRHIHELNVSIEDARVWFDTISYDIVGPEIFSRKHQSIDDIQKCLDKIKTSFLNA